MRAILVVILGLTLAACSAGSPTAVAQQGKVAGGSALVTVNAIRGKAGASSITRNGTLDVAAKGHADDMAAKSFFGHIGSNGSTVAERVKAKGYNWCIVSENVAKGYRDEAGAIESWRLSPGHYRNMVDGKAREFGLARSGNYWVMVLGAQGC